MRYHWRIPPTSLLASNTYALASGISTKSQLRKVGFRDFRDRSLEVRAWR